MSTAAADFYLGSEEVTSWAVGRCCRILGPGGPGTAPGAVLVSIDPPGPKGEETVVVAPRYSGDTVAVHDTRPVTVNIFRREEPAGRRTKRARLVLTGIGEVYGSFDEADATQGGLG
jgi:hypothetical protein